MKRAMVLSGLDALIAQDFKALHGKRVGVLTHPASVDKDYVHLLTRLKAARIKVTAIFGPEHGYFGVAQDMIAVADHGTHQDFACPIYSLYGNGPDSLSPKPEWFKSIDVLLIDMQDIGTRYYTFVWTAVLCMRIAATTHTPLLVLDRPNPLGGNIVEGGGVDKAFASFVGLYDVPVRHGLSMAEMLRLVRAEEKHDLSIDVLPAPGWKREQLTGGYAWVYPSPNMPTFDTTRVYPGMCLLEATNASEGRGMTRPFEVVGAGYVDADAFARDLNALQEPGVVFRPLSFLPTFHKFGAQLCGGVQIHVTNIDAFKPFRVGLRLTRLLAHMQGFAWRQEPYEFVSDTNAFDLLCGSGAYRAAFTSDKALCEVYDAREEKVAAFHQRRKDALLYPC